MRSSASCCHSALVVTPCASSELEKLYPDQVDSTTGGRSGEACWPVLSVIDGRCCGQLQDTRGSDREAADGVWLVGVNLNREAEVSRQVRADLVHCCSTKTSLGEDHGNY